MSNNFSSARYSCRDYQTAASRFVTSRFLEQVSSRMRNRRYRRAESRQTTTVSSVSLAGSWEPICMEDDYGPPATTAASQGLLTRGPPVHVTEPHLPINRFLRRVLSRKCRVEWRDLIGRHTVAAVIPPRNISRTRSCWTSRLSQVSFAPQAADLRCCRRRKCHVGPNSISSAQSNPFFGQIGRV